MFSEIELKFTLGKTKRTAYLKERKEFIDNAKHWNSDMQHYIEGQYLPEIMELINSYEEPLIFIEVTLDFSDWVPEGFGTADVLIITKDIIHVVDLKYGKGVPVSAIDNSQLRLYVLGALKKFGLIYDFKKVRMTIMQPRLHETSTCEMPVEELLDWAENVVKPAAAKAFEGTGEFKPSESNCRFCKARARCRARADHCLEIARREFVVTPFEEDVLLGPLEISELLKETGEIQRWAADVENYALVKARDHGVKFPGWKLVEGRGGNRKFKVEEATVKEILVTSGYELGQIIKPTELKTLTELEKLLGKKFGELLGDLVIRPPGKPALVPENDKRPELNSALTDFDDDF